MGYNLIVQRFNGNVMRIVLECIGDLMRIYGNIYGGKTNQHSMVLILLLLSLLVLLLIIYIIYIIDNAILDVAGETIKADSHPPPGNTDL